MQVNNFSDQTTRLAVRLEPPPVDLSGHILVTHPTYAIEMIGAITAGGPGGKAEVARLLSKIDVIFSENCPKRLTVSIWYPPPESKFCAYGPEDEAWMAPLGLGQWKHIDKGPWLAMIETKREKAFRRLEEGLLQEMSQLFGNGFPPLLRFDEPILHPRIPFILSGGT